MVNEKPRLADAVPQAGVAYVVTVASDGRAHVAPVDATVRDDGTVALDDLGRRSRANLAAGSAVTVLFSPGDPGAHSLIVDGAAIAGAGAGAETEAEDAVVRPERAVLHRPGRTGTGDGPGCAGDCIEVAIR